MLNELLLVCPFARISKYALDCSLISYMSASEYPRVLTNSDLIATFAQPNSEKAKMERIILLNILAPFFVISLPCQLSS